MEKVLMSIEEVCKYTGWGMTKTREILKRSDSDFTIRVGNRLYSTIFLILTGLSPIHRRFKY